MSILTDKYRTNIVIISIIVLLIVGIVGLYHINQDRITEDNVINWKGPGGIYKIDIQKQGSMTVYVTTVSIQGKQMSYPLRYSPVDLQNISLQMGVLTELLDKKGVYVTKDVDLINKTNGDSTIAAIEFGEILGSGQFGLYQKAVKSTYTTEINSKEPMPTITCSNVTNNIAVIYMKIGEQNKIYLDKNCIILEATNSENLIKVGEKLAYKLLGVF